MLNNKIYEILVLNENHKEMFSYHYSGNLYTEEEVKNEFKKLVLKSCFNEDGDTVPVNLYIKSDKENGNLLYGYVKYRWYYMDFFLKAYDEKEFFLDQKQDNWLDMNDDFELTPSHAGLTSRKSLNDHFEKLLIKKPDQQEEQFEVVRMHDSGAVYDIKISASVDQVEELKDSFDMGNSSVFAFERLIKAKGYEYEIIQVGGERRSGAFE